MITKAARCRLVPFIRLMMVNLAIAHPIVAALTVDQISASADQLSIVQQVTDPVATEQKHLVTEGDTLWNVAERLRPSYLSIPATMNLLHATNPEAFVDGDITKLKKGYLLSFIPPAVEWQPPAQSTANIDASAVSPQVVDSESAGLLESNEATDSSQIEIKSEPEAAIADKPDTEPLIPEPELISQATLQPQSDTGQQPNRDKPMAATAVLADTVEIAPHSNPDNNRIANKVEQNQQLPAENPATVPASINDQAPTAATAVSADTVEITPDSNQIVNKVEQNQQLPVQNPAPIFEPGNNGVESKVLPTGNLAKPEHAFNDFRDNPPFSLILAALLALLLIILFVRRPRKQLPPSESADVPVVSRSESTGSTTDNLDRQQVTEEGTDSIESLTDPALIGLFSSDDADDPESSTASQPENINSRDIEIEIPGQKELEAQMRDELNELQPADLTSDSDTEHLDYIDPFKVKLDMATLTAEMGDTAAAREILEEIIREADQSIKEQAIAALEKLDE